MHRKALSIDWRVRMVASALTLPVRAITPLAFLYVAYMLIRMFTTLKYDANFSLDTTFTAIELALLVYSLLEVVFLLNYYRVLKRLQQPPVPPPFSDSERHALFQRCIDQVDDIAYHLSSWFFGADKDSVCRENFEDWLAWTFFCRDRDSLNSDEIKLLTKYSTEACAKIGWTPREGRDPKIRCIRMTLDTIKSVPRPLLVYVFTTLVDAASKLLLSALGFKHQRSGTVSFWKRTPAVKDETREPPLVFVHGIGIGFASYMIFLLRMLFQNQHRKIIFIELPHLSMRLREDVVAVNDMLDAVDAVIRDDDDRPERCTWVGHSFGTIIIGWVVRHRPHLIDGVLMVDPVCFMLWDGELVKNFLHREPTNLFEILMLYYLSRELYIAYVIHRHFWWFENLVFPDDFKLDGRIHVFVASLDSVINAKRTNQYLEDNGIPTTVSHGAQHGSFLFNVATQDSIFNEIARISSSKSDKAQKESERTTDVRTVLR